MRASRRFAGLYLYVSDMERSHAARAGILGLRHKSRHKISARISQAQWAGSRGWGYGQIYPSCNCWMLAWLSEIFQFFQKFFRLNSQHSEQKANILYPGRARRPEDRDAMTEADLAELRRSLFMLSGPAWSTSIVMPTRTALSRGNPDRRVVQRLVTAWKILRRWRWR
jgi:hypothetical protein